MEALMPIVEQLSNLTLLEASRLVKHLEARWGASAQPAPAPPPQPVHPGPEPAPTFAVVLAGVAGSRIEVIRALRELFGLGLQEARALLESAPKVLREGLTGPDRDALVARLTAAGAQIEVR